MKILVIDGQGGGIGRALIEKIIRAQAVVANLNRTGRPADQVKADAYRDLIGELLMMREEWRHANCPPN